MSFLLEVCAGSVQSAIAAQEGGADRIELCSGLVIGGLSPSPALFREVRRNTDIKVRVLLRPRFGDFCYDGYEFSVLRDEVEMFRDLGADGVVIGILDPDGTMNMEQMEELVKAAGGIGVTMHRAFDVCRDPFEALEQCVSLGIDTILTSGQKSSAWEGRELLRQLADRARGRLDILAGAGIEPDVIGKLAEYTGVRSFHMSGKKVVDSRMEFRREGVPMGLPGLSEFEIWQTAAEKVREASVVKMSLAASEAIAERTGGTAKPAADEAGAAYAEGTAGPALAVMNAYVGDEKLLDMGEDYDSLRDGSGSIFSGTAWKADELNSRIVIAANQDVHNVQVTASDLQTEDGRTISKDNIDIRWLKEVTANEGRNAAGQKKKYPDIIYKGGAIDMKANDVRFAWVQIAVPGDTAAGTYTGMVRVTADELDQAFELTYTVEVINLVQPTARDVGYEVQIWQHPFSVANYYLGLEESVDADGNRTGICNESAEAFYFTEEHFALMKDSMQAYRELGGRDVAANIVEEAWNHQSFYGDPSMVRWTKKEDGTWEFDYDWYDKWISFQIEMGILDPANGEGQIKCYSIVPWNNQIAYCDEESGTTKKEVFLPGTDAFREMWTIFLTDFMKHSEEMGWFDITYISMDERGLDLLKPAVDVIESVTNGDGKSFKISSAMNAESLHEREFLKRVDDISINLDNAGDVELMKEAAAERRAQGLKTTYYTCTGNYPGSFMISDPGDNYWTAWYSLTLGTDGFLRWAWDNYLYDMFGDATYRYWEPGDGWYMYPAERGAEDTAESTVYSTPRLELFRQGVRDACKAKYLLSSDRITEEQKEVYRAVVENLRRPEKTMYAGAAVPADEEQRMLAHRETARALKAANDLARQIADKTGTPEQGGVICREKALDKYKTMG